MKRLLYICLAVCCLASCAKQPLPGFRLQNDLLDSRWTLRGNTVANDRMQVNFGGESATPLTNASNGGYELNFITSKEEFDAYNPDCAGYMASVIRQIPLKVDFIDVILADQYMILTVDPNSRWEPDYIRRTDGAIITVQANPMSDGINADGELWRNLIFNNSMHQLIVVDRLVKNGRHYAIVYVLQSESKGSPISRAYQFDITDRRNTQTVGAELERLFDISIKALETSPCVNENNNR